MSEQPEVAVEEPRAPGEEPEEEPDQEPEPQPSPEPQEGPSMPVEK